MFWKSKRETVKSLEEMTRRRSQWRDVMGRLFRNKTGFVGLCICAILIILVVFAPVFTSYNPLKQSVPERFLYPSSEHIFGTDDFGRDLWARILYGGRISLLIAFIAVIISTVGAIILGSCAGYFGGAVDQIITRVMDVMMSIPGLLLAIAISSALGAGLVNTALAIAIPGIAPGARIIRSTVMSIKDCEYVEAAKASGSKNFRLIMIHIIPNCIAPLIVNATLSIGGNIMAISGLSFIGLGVQAPTPEWGAILSTGKTYLRDFWPLVFFPALFIMLTILGFNLFGDALRDALDPRLKD
ncbi:MAG: ABC transporter permease [Clostridiales bacterium]|nr:ABC transporter permease [Clostridiales bacterium]